MRGQICEMCESRPATCGWIDTVNQETIFLCYHCSEKLEDIHERLWGHVVRCKDCKYWHGHREYERPMLCHRWQDITLPTLADDFCSKGEKKDE